jgi:hypothetical protein
MSQTPLLHSLILVAADRLGTSSKLRHVYAGFDEG